tara:strand:- start:890 stop:1177 length:288 start_codon:yes stop_codon:yes gene_type:complete
VSEERLISEQQLHANPELGAIVEKETELKNYLVEYVGTKFNQEEVTVAMIVDIMALEFPEFMLAIAEENFLRGYKSGLDDAYGTNNTQTERTAEK